MRKNIEDITKFIFIKDEPEKSDIIFIPGSSNWGLAETAAKLYKRGLSNKIIPSGMYFYKIGKFLNERVTDERYKGNYRTEAEFLSAVLVKNGVSDQDILMEEKATNTYENAIFSKELAENNGIEVKSAIICPQAFHARRAFMTYSHLFHNTKLYVVPTDTQGISEDNWYKTERGIEVVLGELRKCGEYFEEYINEFGNRAVL
ncbi:MAG: YdcF family protein [Catonella sp.]|uniref:YdcF family protein n=1 Tax=Catonella sp. TaxID=2382125 RepID=UPI003F9F9572